MEEQLIEAVRRYTVLYDTNHVDYMKTKLKQDIWNKLARDFNLRNGDESKSLWIKLRNNHRDALRRQRNCMKSGASVSSMKQWRFQKQMEFLLPYMFNKQKENNLDEDSDTEHTQLPVESIESSVKIEDHIIGDFEDYSTPRENSDNFLELTDVNEEPEKHEPISFSNCSTTRQVHKKKDDISNYIKWSIIQHERAALEREKRVAIKPPDDELYHFFMSMYKTTKKMPLSSQHTVKIKVFQAVSQEEGDLLNTNCTQ